MSFCGKCGCKNPDSNKFCSQCGAQLMHSESCSLQNSAFQFYPPDSSSFNHSSTSVPIAESSDSKTGSNRKEIIAVIAVIMIAAVVAAFVLSDQSTDSPHREVTSFQPGDYFKIYSIQGSKDPYYSTFEVIMVTGEDSYQVKVDYGGETTTKSMNADELLCIISPDPTNFDHMFDVLFHDTIISELSFDFERSSVDLNTNFGKKSCYLYEATTPYGDDNKYEMTAQLWIDKRTGILYQTKFTTSESSVIHSVLLLGLYDTNLPRTG